MDVFRLTSANTILGFPDEFGSDFLLTAFCDVDEHSQPNVATAGKAEGIIVPTFADLTKTGASSKSDECNVLLLTADDGSSVDS